MSATQSLWSQQDVDVFASVFMQHALASRTKQLSEKPRRKFYDASIKQALTDAAAQALGIGHSDFRIGTFISYFSASNTKNSPSLTKADAAQHARKLSRLTLWRTLPAWKSEIGVDRLEKLLAVVVDKALTDFVAWSYSGSWEDSVIEHLRFWVENVLIPFISYAQARLQGLSSQPEADVVKLKKWSDVAISRLATLRVAELFDVIVAWDATAPVIDDLRHFITSPATRSHLTNDFSTVLTQRLLHPGASTIEILQIYISIIRAFRKLDSKGVLLERVGRKIRRYLRDRDDTIRVVVMGLLADLSLTQHSIQHPDTLSELAVELQQHDPTIDRSDVELDWNNMEWNPDPVDAAPDYLKSKNTDVIGSVISLFDSKDIFVKELQTHLADRLLKNKADFDQEISIVEHLKLRLGDAVLQGCEVMLRDVLDSRKVDATIRHERYIAQNCISGKRQPVLQAQEQDGELHTKILSRLFWPPLQEQTFEVPAPIQKQQNAYEQGFESLKQSRKLTWLNAVGQVEVELEFEDRTFEAEVLTWQASVIYAFQPIKSRGVEESKSSIVSGSNTNSDADNQLTQPETRTVTSLAMSLQMSPTLVRAACHFWVSQNVLKEEQKDTFTVLETLESTGNKGILSSTITSGPNIRGSALVDPDRSSSSLNPTAQATGSGRGSGIRQGQAEINAAAAVAAAAAAQQAEAESQSSARRAQFALYRNFITSMLTNQGAMPLPRIAMMLGIVVPGGFPLGNEELRSLLEGMVREGEVEVGPGGSYKMKS